jgi:SAM-dependent methyltransferase
MKFSTLAERVAVSRTFTNLSKIFHLNEKVVLDIGCSEGYYLAHFGEGSVGVTLIDTHIADAKTRGLRVIKANIEDPNFSMTETFDVVWANNLFEHMNAPHLFLTNIRKFLNPKGVLILGVPVLPYVPFLTRFKKFRGAYAVSHVNFFSRKTLTETVRAGGWIVEEARLFYFKHPVLDALLHFITPHVYVIARPNPDFSYAEKRLQSLAGY